MSEAPHASQLTKEIFFGNERELWRRGNFMAFAGVVLIVMLKDLWEAEATLLLLLLFFNYHSSVSF
jgi:hypothetical protein